MSVSRLYCLRQFAFRAAAILFVGAGLSSCSQLTHQSEWLSVSNGSLDSNDLHYALPRGVISVTATNAAAALSVADPVQVLVPDRHARYAVHIDPSILAHDKYDLKTANGLLSSSKSDNFDKTPEIAQTLTQLTTQGLKLSLLRSGAGASEARTAKWVKETVVVDPFAAKGAAGCNSQSGLRSSARGCLSGLQVTATDIDGGPLPAYTKDEVELTAQRCKGSLCSRMLRPVRVSVRLPGLVASEHIIMAPDPGMVVGHDVRRGPCIQRVTTLTFTNGLLDNYALDKPSELSECLKIPLTVVQEVVKSLQGLITVKVEQYEKENTLLELQKSRFDAIAALMKAQADFAVAAQTADVRATAENVVRAAERSAGDRAEINALRAAQQTTEEAEARDRCNAKGGNFPACMEAYQSCRRDKSHAACLP